MRELNWVHPEYEFKQQSADWFWALGIIVVATSATSIILGNYFFGLLLIIAGVLIGFFSIKEPSNVPYKISSIGVHARDKIYPFKKILSYYVQTDDKPMLFIRSERLAFPIIEIPIEKQTAEEIKSIMTEMNIKEEEMAEHSSVKIMEFLGI